MGHPFGKTCVEEKDIPRRLKPHGFYIVYGTIEVVPLQNHNLLWSLNPSSIFQ